MHVLLEGDYYWQMIQRQSIILCYRLRIILGFGGSEGGSSDRNYSETKNPIESFKDLFDSSRGNSYSNPNPLENFMDDLLGNN